MFDRSKTINVLDCAATGISSIVLQTYVIKVGEITILQMATNFLGVDLGFYTV